MGFVASRLKLARQRRGISQTELADAAGLSDRSIIAYESGKTMPRDEHVDALAKALRFPKSFFDGADIDPPQPDIASFRSMKKMTAMQRDTALAAGAIAIEISGWIETEFGLPPPQIPHLRGAEPDAAAASVRESWGLGVKPIKNMVHLLEARGVRVFSLVQDSPEVDAFSLWRATVPFIFLNTIKSGDRGRFDAAHELGHLVLHRHGEPSGREAEREADAFASAFLMPRESVIEFASRASTLDQILSLKKIWGVSAAALAYRLKALRLLTEWRYRSLLGEMAERGYLKNEPQAIARETSQTFAKVFSVLREEGKTKSDVARQLGLYVSDLEAVIFGLALIPPSENPEVVRPTNSPDRPQLRLAFKRD
jgi:Zn-dependent peptidase ImmA (M78 family)/transcriptional regulator with XRE-family HTH domain